MQKNDDSDLLACLRNLQTIATAGFILALHVRFNAPTLMFRTYPDAWIDYYARNNLVLSDPSVAWGMANTGARRWSDMPDTGDVLRQARAHGLSFGLTCSMADGPSRSLCGFAHDSRDFETAEVERLQDRAARLHAATAGHTHIAPQTAQVLKKMQIKWQQSHS